MTSPNQPSIEDKLAAIRAQFQNPQPQGEPDTSSTPEVGFPAAQGDNQPPQQVPQQPAQQQVPQQRFTPVNPQQAPRQQFRPANPQQDPQQQAPQQYQQSAPQQAPQQYQQPAPQRVPQQYQQPAPQQQDPQAQPQDPHAGYDQYAQQNQEFAQDASEFLDSASNVDPYAQRYGQFEDEQGVSQTPESQNGSTRVDGGDLDTFFDDEPEPAEEERGPAGPVIATSGFKGFINRVFRTKLTDSADYDDEGDDELTVERRRNINTPINGGAKVIAVMGSKGGVGKSSTVQGIGSTIAYYRKTGGGVVAADLDFNSTLLKMTEPNANYPNKSSIARLAKDANIQSVADVNSHLVFNTDGLAVLPGVAQTGDPRVSPAQVHNVLQKLGVAFDVILLDFPGSNETDIAEAALMWADNLVFVTEVAAPAIQNTKRELKRINTRRADLVSNATVILNHGAHDRGDDIVVANLDDHVQSIRNLSRTGGIEVFEMDWDKHLSRASRLELGNMGEDVQDLFLDVTSRIMSGLPNGPSAYTTNI